MNALNVENMNVHYGAVHAVQGVSFQVAEREIVSIVGSNGAGKSTIMWALSGVKGLSSGRIELFGAPLPSKPHEVVAHRLALVPERRRLFSDLSVNENLIMGAYLRSDCDEVEYDMERCFELFPVLKQRLRQRSGTLSGGEQQMLAVGRALLARPKLMMMDEPSLGLAPLVVRDIFEIIRQLSAEGITILLIEQNANAALRAAHYGYVLETGSISISGEGRALLEDSRVRDAYLGEAKDRKKA